MSTSGTKALEGGIAFLCHGPKALNWYCKNAAFQVTIPFKSHPKAVLNEQQQQHFDAGLTDLFKKYTAAIKKADIGEAFKVLNATIHQKETCHGTCLALLEQVLKNPSLRGEQLLEILSKLGERIAYFQSIEIIRGQLCDASAKEEAAKLHDSIEASHFPKVDRILELKFSDMKEVFAVFQGLKEEVCVVRCWNVTKRSIAHSLLFCYSEKNEQFWFFDIKTYGIFAYKNFPDLLKGFVGHLKAFVGNACKPGGIFMLERHELLTKS